MKLNTLTIDEAALRAELTNENSEHLGLEEYKHEDIFDQDYMIQEVSNIVSGLLNSGNAALAGTRVRPIDGTTLEPDESIDMIYSADSDGSVGGFIFVYSLWGARRLELNSRYVEARHMHGDSDGIDGLVDIANYIVALINASIEDFNEFVAAA